MNIGEIRNKESILTNIQQERDQGTLKTDTIKQIKKIKMSKDCPKEQDKYKDLMSTVEFDQMIKYLSNFYCVIFRTLVKKNS